jgi:hypothetical protein
VKRLAALFALPSSDRTLLIEAAGAILLFRLGLAFVGVERLRAWSGRLARRQAPTDRVAWAVGAVSRRLPGTSCLASALAAQRLLSVRGRASDLHIGVAKQEKKFAAHAWLVSEGRIVIGDSDGDTYELLTSWHSTSD